jgi:hypothetical protein
VVLITGNGYKTSEIMSDRVIESVKVGRSVRDIEAVIGEDIAPTSS